MDFISEMNKLRDKGKKVYDMAVGDPNLPVPPRIIGGLEYALKSGVHQYSPVNGYLGLRKKIYPEAPERVVVGNGAKELIHMIINDYYGSEQVLILGPTWPCYREMCLHCSYSELNLDFSKNIIEQILEKINIETKLIILCNPNNPTGMVWDKENLLAIVELCQEFKMDLLVDETYEDYVYEGEFFSMVNQPNTMVVKSLSKKWSIAGWRMGYIIFPEWHDLDLKIFSDHKRESIGCPNSLIQKAIEHSWDDILDDNRLAVMRERRDALAEIIGNSFAKTGKKLEIPQAGFYFFVPLSVDADLIVSKLLNYNIFTTSGRAFGDPNYIRLSFANISVEDIKEIQPILAEIFDKY